MIAVQEYLYNKKHWINIRNETIEQRKAGFCLVYGQMKSDYLAIEDELSFSTIICSKKLSALEKLHLLNIIILLNSYIIS